LVNLAIQAIKMKTKAFLAIVILISIFSSCDKIDGPYSNAGGDTDTSTAGFFRKVLVEDFTGHKCGNCPDAGEALKQLKALYGGKIVTMAVHAGFFAEPNSGGLFTYDFRTSEGTELDQFFGNSNAGLPNGLINRKFYDANPIVNFVDWASKVNEIINTPADAWITMDPTYNGDSRSLDVTVNSKILSSISDSLQLAVYITEDSIVRPQADYSLPSPNQYIPEYVHRHAFRGSMNGTWGTPLSVGNSFNAGQEFNTQYSFNLPSEWNANKIQLVAVLYKVSTREVVQAEEVHIIE
jgi:thiol-disulfide isomerase/thioredoxin